MLAMHGCMARPPLPHRWDDIRTLLAVLRAGSFTRAATLLQTEQSTISRRIAALEKELGVALFERGPQAPTPTQAALSLREVAERVEAEVGVFFDTATDEREQKAKGRVRLALTEEMATFFVIPAVLPQLRKNYPELYVDLITSYRAADLMGHEADIALRFFRSSRGDLIGKKIGTLPTAILCPRSRAGSWSKRKPEDLPWISVELGGPPPIEARWLQSLTATPPVLICSSYHAQLAAIRAGLGVGIGPAVVPSLERAFVSLPSPHLELPHLDLFLFTRRAIRTLPRITTVLDALEHGLSPFVRT